MPTGQNTKKRKLSYFDEIATKENAIPMFSQQTRPTKYFKPSVDYPNIVPTQQLCPLTQKESAQAHPPSTLSRQEPRKPLAVLQDNSHLISQLAKLTVCNYQPSAMKQGPSPLKGRVTFEDQSFRARQVPQANYRTPQTFINLQREKFQRKPTGFGAQGFGHTLQRNRSACELGSPVNNGNSFKMESVGAPNRVFECAQGSNNKGNTFGNGFGHRRARSQDGDKVASLDVQMRE